MTTSATASAQTASGQSEVRRFGGGSATHELAAVRMAAAVSVGAALLWGVLLLGMIQVSVWETPRPEPAYHAKLAKLPPGPMLAIGDAAHGHEVFETTCACLPAAAALESRAWARVWCIATLCSRRPTRIWSRSLTSGETSRIL